MPNETLQPPPRYLIIGFEHPFGAELSRALQARYGPDQVEGTNDLDNLATFIGRWRPTDVYLLTSLFPSADAEHPAAHWHRSTRGLLKVLNLARRFRLFYPSSIAVFGTTAPTINCPDDAPQDPVSYYGLNKRAAERWCEHYFLEHEIDVRSLRFPVIIRPSKQSLPSQSPLNHASADQSSFAQDLTRQDPPSPNPPSPNPPGPNPSKQSGKKEISQPPLAPTNFPSKPPITSATAAAIQTRPVLHLLDAVRATIEIMSAPATAIRNRRSYNLTGTSLSLTELAAELQRETSSPGIEIFNLPQYPGPTSLDDSGARTDWGWKPHYDLVQLIGSFLPTH